MKFLKIIFVLAVAIFSMSSCVTMKKYKALSANFVKAAADDTDCHIQLSASRSAGEKLSAQNADLQSQIDALKKQLEDQKKTTAQTLSTLQDMSVMSGKQAESVKESLKTLEAKDKLINNLHSEMARRDSLNLALVLNLKGAISDISDQDINIKVEKSAIFIDISDKMLFNSGKHTVTPRAKEVLGKVAKVLNAYPDIEFMVEGHTDSVAIHTECMEDNWDLSVKRATSVVRILQKQYGIAPARMTAAGRSQYLPLQPNTSSDGRAINRRTRIVILPQLDQFFKLLIMK